MPLSVLGLVLVLAVYWAPSDTWTARLVFLIGVGAVVAALTVVGDRTAAREVEVTREERRLYDQRAALVQTISHEFRTPLTIIHAVAETLMERQELLAEPLRPLAPALHRAERRLSNMVEAVLAAADELGDDVEQEAVEVAPLVREIAEELGSGAAERVRVAVAPGSGRPVTSRPHARLLLRCLVDNAIRFSGPDDPVDVRVETGDERTTIAIRDWGVGIDPGFVGRAFEPFTQADSSTVRQHGGLGLGLYTARHLARRLGGEVDLRPAEEGGSLAVVRLPQRREADRTGAPRRS